MRCATLLLVVTVVAGTQRPAYAQNVTVQQPAFGRFSVGTTVSVPDRGRALLGGVSRAGEGRKRYGFFQPGSSVGLFREHSGVSAGVYIHDLRAMDEWLLNQGRANRAGDGGRLLTRNASHAYRQLTGGRAATQNLPSATTARSARVSRPAASSVFGGEDPASKFYNLGRRAEERGKLSLARLHYRMAAKHGSALARAKLSRGLRSVASRK